MQLDKGSRRPPGARRDLVMLRAPESPAANAYRVALQQLQQTALREGRARFLVVGVEGSADAAAAVANIGVAAARVATRIVLVDADTREPRLHNLLGVDGTGGPQPRDVGAGFAVQETHVPGLCLMAAGQFATGSVDVLANPAFAEALRQATACADLVLVTSAPVLTGADATLVACLVDGAILVVSADGTRREDAERAREQIERAGAPVIGAVFAR